MPSRAPGGIVLYLPHLPLGGIERATIALAHHWTQQGRPVTLLLDRAEGPLLAELRPELAVDILGASRTAFALPPLLAYLRRRRPSLLHSALPWNSLVALLAGRLTGIPVSVAEHSLMNAKPGAKARFLPTLMRRTYPAAAAILAPSAAVAADLAAVTGLNPDRIAVVGNPVVPTPLPHPLPQPPRRSSWRSAASPRSRISPPCCTPSASC